MGLVAVVDVDDTKLQDDGEEEEEMEEEARRRVLSLCLRGDNLTRTKRGA